MVGAVARVARRNGKTLLLIREQILAFITTLLMVWLIVPTVVSADIAGRESGRYQFLQQAAGPLEEGVRIRIEYPGFDYDVGWKVQNVEGQAVTQAQIMWWFPKGRRLPLPNPPGGSLPVSQIPESIWRHINLYDSRFQVILHRRGFPENRYSLILDLGIPNRPGDKEWSLNVPRALPWNRLLTHYQGPGRDNNVYVSADDAKSIIGQGSPRDRNDEDIIVVENSWLLDAKMSTAVFNHKLLAARLDWHADVMVRAVRSHLDNLKIIAKLPIEKLVFKLEHVKIVISKDMKAIPGDLDQLYDKLNSGVPNKYIIPVRRAFYHKERLRIADEAKRELLLLSLGRYVDKYPAWFDEKVKNLGLE
ncbi:hypothetical protein [Kiloniella antarctica]|uniref:DUF4340 domain-containing protein n=1 Tax=Kiloniella antarctica TaxID=1550907 RepID=A0ABW5BI53_9PROT